jgi:CRP-like cAMP-binding protein
MMVKNLASPRPPPTERPKNRLLRALPEADFQRLLPDLKTIPSTAKQVFHRHGEPVKFVYFPNGGVASVTAVMADGTMVETATVGNEGVVGIEAFFANDAIAPGETLMQVPDTSVEQLSVAAFRRETALNGAFANVVGRYAQAAMSQMMQSAACNARHHIEERCPRWLLMTHDRVGADTFHLSHEYLGVMLGVRRQSVTVVAGTLQSAGLITYKHGLVTVLNRKGLEAAACECYALVRRKFDDLLS